MSDETTVILLDSATRFEAAHRGQVVICGSHGGVYCGYLAAAAGLRAVILNDAGGGLDQAGLGCLDYCERPDRRWCRHGGARSHQRHERRGCESRMQGRHGGGRRGQASLRSAVAGLVGSSLSGGAAGRHAGGRFVLDRLSGSVTLVTGDDVGQIVLTGSHGGLMGGLPEGALKVDAFAALFNDADVGVDDAGLGRLAALDIRGIAGATVDAVSARIGDGLSTYEDGRLSYVNDRAVFWGLKPGMSARQAIDQLQSGER